MRHAKRKKLIVIVIPCTQDNILIAAGPHKTKTCKFIDFGFAVEITSGSHITDGKRVGTPGYMAQEIAQRRHYNCTADVWSLGVVFFQVTRTAEALRLFIVDS
jgi:serine/threonine protein kinase